MSDPSDLSRRERQIMDAVYSLGEATVKQVVETIPDPPTSMSVRRLMHILVEKGQGKGREVSYRPRKAKAEAGQSALQGVLETFFGALSRTPWLPIWSQARRASAQRSARGSWR